jgi:hypothetical protein
MRGRPARRLGKPQKPAIPGERFLCQAAIGGSVGGQIEDHQAAGRAAVFRYTRAPGREDLRMRDNILPMILADAAPRLEAAAGFAKAEQDEEQNAPALVQIVDR